MLMTIYKLIIYQMFGLFRRQDNTKPPIPPKKKQVSQDFYEPNKATLPQNFAQSVLDLEMRLQFDESFTMQTIQGLNELYRIAIQYYINVDPKKMLHFQRKLHNLLTHPRTLSIIENKDKERAKSMNPRPAPPSNINSKMKEEVSKFNSQANTVVKNIIQSSEQKLTSNENIIRNSLKKQEADVRNRIMERSRSRQKKT